MCIEYVNIGELIAQDVKHYLMKHHGISSEGADRLCRVYENQVPEIQNLSWWDIVGMAMQQSIWLYDHWLEVKNRPPIRLQQQGVRVIPKAGLIAAPEGIRPLGPRESATLLKSIQGGLRAT